MCTCVYAHSHVHVYVLFAYIQVQRLEQIIQDPVLLDLLKHMLDYNPETRIPAHKVRAHTRTDAHAHMWTPSMQVCSHAHTHHTSAQKR